MKQMGTLHQIEDAMPHVVHETICVACHRRQIDVAPAQLPLKDYECAGCGKRGTIILTGQVFQGTKAMFGIE